MFCGGDLAHNPVTGQIDGRYTIERELGRGSMGVVYLARDVSLNRTVAIKALAPGIASYVEPDAVRREAAALAAIHSENVVGVHAFGTDRGTPFFVMEYVKGEDLSKIIDSHNKHDQRVPLRRSLGILRQLAEGLDLVHKEGIVHRDVKPGNVVIEEKTGRPVLIDFGLSIPSEALAGKGNTVVVGTPGYIGPEYLRDPIPAPAPTADVFALACTAFALLTGARVYDADEAKERLMMPLFRPPRLPSQIVPEYARFDAVFKRALASDPSARTPTCSDFVAELEAAAAPWLSQKESIHAPRGSSAEIDAEPPKVLIVDDDADLRTLLARAAQVVFHGDPTVTIGGVGRGSEALLLARVKMPSLVVLDYDMPGLNGVDTLTRLRELPGGSKARVLVVSAKLDQLLRWRFDVLGVNDFLQKPFELRDLIDLLSRLGASMNARAR
jgi:serine/threonine-protein kinase